LGSKKFECISFEAEFQRFLHLHEAIKIPADIACSYNLPTFSL